MHSRQFDNDNHNNFDNNNNDNIIVIILIINLFVYSREEFQPVYT